MKKTKKEITDSQNIDNFIKREKLRWAIMVMSIITIILALLSLTIRLGFGYALIAYVITHVLISMRNKLEIEESELIKTKREERLAQKEKKKAMKKEMKKNKKETKKL